MKYCQRSFTWITIEWRHRWTLNNVKVKSRLWHHTLVTNYLRNLGSIETNGNLGRCDFVIKMTSFKPGCLVSGHRFQWQVTVGPNSLETFPVPCKRIFCVYRWFHLSFLEQLLLVEQYHAVSISSTRARDLPAACFPLPISHTMTFTTTLQVYK